MNIDKKHGTLALVHDLRKAEQKQDQKGKVNELRAGIYIAFAVLP